MISGRAVSNVMAKIRLANAEKKTVRKGVENDAITRDFEHALFVPQVSINDCCVTLGV